MYAGEGMTHGDAMTSLQRWEREAVVRCRHEGWRPHLISMRYDNRPQGDLVAVLGRIVRGDPPVTAAERRMCAKAVADHAVLFDRATIEAAADLLG